MPRQSNGTYQQPANTAAVPSTPIGSSAYNTLITDLGNEITNSLDRGGRSAMTAALPMGGQKITGMADPTVATDGATKNYVDTTTAAFFSTGDVKMTIKNVADTGWILCDDGTFGSATSGGTSRANADTQPLFNLLFNNTNDSNVPLYTSGGSLTTRAAQTNAATAWAANCRMSLPRVLGRAMAGAGQGSGLTLRGLCTWNGEETHVLTTTEMPSHRHSVFISDNGHTHATSLPSRQLGTIATNTGNPIVGIQVNNGSDGSFYAASSLSGVSITSGDSVPNSTLANGSNGAHNNLQPTAYFNVMVKL
ncbi:hypothetical protein CK489_15435 [Bradyrhizobium sp. UFLA03-84]|uniref:hypothetical protein n=1 Tax=Bradyrhizobium sp. UFLA03-84 TaxID=418599 RepID=UPI000BAE123C|nr:hypothetical protein [Bradyrhizobium sp. UFLA03-84]PAY07191.1 hypothetical protein CK489_15435 [Bradyrhizobium sp. UFLA03-84]